MTDEMLEIEYNRARRLIESNEYKKLVEAKDVLIKIGDYKNANKYLIEVNSKINLYESELENKKLENYNRAVELISSKKTSQKLDQAIKLFKELDDYKDSKELLEKTLEERKKIMVKDRKNLDRFKLVGYLCAGIGVVIIAFLILAVIWTLTE